MISKGEIEFLRIGINQNIRLDGRNNLQFRDYNIECGNILFPNTLNGIKVIIPESNCSINIGINAEIIIKDNTLNDEYIIIEIKTTNNYTENKYINEINSLVNKYIKKHIDLKKLELYNGKLSWKIYCDIYIIGDIGLNCFNYIYKGIKTALIETKFPLLDINYNNWNEKFSYDILNDKINMYLDTDFPHIYLFGEFNNNLIFDLNKNEIIAVDTIYISVISYSKKILSIEKIDGSSIKFNRISKLINDLFNSVSELVNIL